MGLAWDRTGGPHAGRVYLISTAEQPNESNNTDIYVRHSDDNGATWSAAVRVNDDNTASSQFLPKISVNARRARPRIGPGGCRCGVPLPDR